MRFGKWRGVSLACRGGRGARAGLGFDGSRGWLAPSSHAARRGPGLRLHHGRRVLRPARPVRTLRERPSRRSRQGHGAPARVVPRRGPRSWRGLRRRLRPGPRSRVLGTAAAGATTAGKAAAFCRPRALSPRLIPGTDGRGRKLRRSGRRPRPRAQEELRSLPRVDRDDVRAGPAGSPGSSARLGPGDCGDPGCGVKGKHSHFGNLASKLHCRLCGGEGCGGCGGCRTRRPLLWLRRRWLRGLRRLRPVQAWPRRNRLRALRRQGLRVLPEGARLQGSRAPRRPAPPPEVRLLRRPWRAGALDPRLCPLHRHNPISAGLLFVPANES